MGTITGFLLRKRPVAQVHRAITVLIWLLLFLLGLEVGHNDHIIKGLRTIGLQAAVISITATLGSVLSACLLWHILKRKS